MAYGFTFDLSSLSQSFFRDLAKFSRKKKIHEKMGGAAKYIIKKFNVDNLTGLPFSDSVTIVEDMIDMNLKNLAYREEFLRTNKRALFLPHCSRKHMDSKCKATFDPEMSSYHCMHCSDDCIVNKATKLGTEKNYDVYIVPGGSGIRKVLQKKGYDGIVGVACTEEMKLGSKLLEHIKKPGQAVPLIKNGCSATKFNLDTFAKTL